ncbi:MAG TPA: YfhO family protein [Gammaproteobacteria bacterium]|nr:YfhO family protein [Gammaproteobacteria bacterium]
MLINRGYLLFNYQAFFIISIIALVFGYWFATNQLHAISDQAFSSYPTEYFLLTIIKCYFTIIAFYLFALIITCYFSVKKIAPLAIAASFSPLILVYAHLPLYWIAFSIISLQACLLIYHAKKPNISWLKSNCLVDSIVFCILLITHFFLTTAYSPLHWDNAMLVNHGSISEEIIAVTPMFKGFVLAKLFSFSSFDHSLWGGILNPPITLSSPYLMLVSFIFDLPSVDVASFHALHLFTLFTLIVGGSFGLYLFLKYAAKVHTIFALVGGLLFFFSAAPYNSLIMGGDAGIFLSSYAVCPYAMLMIALAFKKNNITLACWAGAALAAQFFFLAPHPEGVIYALFFYGLFVLGLGLFSTALTFKRRVWLITISFIAFFALSAFTIVPILYDQLSGNMRVFAHADVITTPSGIFADYNNILLLFIPLSLLVFLKRNAKKQRPLFLSVLFLTLSFWLFTFLTTCEGFNAWLLKILHVGLHIWLPHRIGIFFCLPIFIIALMTLNQLTESFSPLFKKFDRLFYYGLTISLVAVVGMLFPLERIPANPRQNNLQDCQYYLSLQSILSNYPGLASDKANINLIKRRLVTFENDVHSSSQPALAKVYQTQYANTLKKFNINSISSVQSTPLILAIAKNSYKTIDNYYLDDKLFCINPLYHWEPTHQRRILRHNLMGLYTELPDHFQRILSAAQAEWTIGPAPGLLPINQTTTMDTRFMTGLPLLTALYVLPKFNFNNAGSYDSAAPWNYLRANFILDPTIRKVLDISGIDIFTVSTAELGNNTIPHTVPLKGEVHPVFQEALKSFINTQSYGLAYLAEEIFYAHPATIHSHEKVIKRYFKRHKNISEFQRVTNELYEKMMTLDKKFAIYLESKNQPLSSGMSEKNQQAAGWVDKKGMVGERAFFVTHCQRENCTFVFNFAYAPGWHALVNDKTSKIQRANFAFLSTEVPTGQATVWFIYEPFYRLISYFISILTLGGIAFISYKKLS